LTETGPGRPLRPGDTVPEFNGTTDSGATVRSADLLGRPAVLFFYPKANSAGCSMESREFARHYEEFTSAGVRVVGISVDAPEAQAHFRETCELPFELIADRDRKVCARFGVLGALGVARRTSFLAGADGRIVDVVRTWRPRRHVEVALERLVRRGRTEDAPAPTPGPEAK
jgi:thioredoxin-dependent peroxiredoxin